MVMVSHLLTFVQGHSDSTFSNFFFLRTARPIEGKFHMEPRWIREMKVSTTGICHMTKTAATPTYGKNLLNSSSLEPKGRCHWILVCGISYLSTSKFIQMMSLD